MGIERSGEGDEVLETIPEAREATGGAQRRSLPSRKNRREEFSVRSQKTSEEGTSHAQSRSFV